MPKAAAVLVKPQVSSKGEAGAGLAVLIPLNVNAASSEACDASESYRGPDGKPLFVRTMPRRQMENELRRAERLDFEGQKHKDVVDGRIPNARAEAALIRKRLLASFTVAAIPNVLTAHASVLGDVGWLSEDARMAATNKHKEIAMKSLTSYRLSGKSNAEELVQIAERTSHPEVALEAVDLAVKAGATKELLLSACDRIIHDGAAVLAYESATGPKKEQKLK